MLDNVLISIVHYQEKEEIPKAKPVGETERQREERKSKTADTQRERGQTG